MTQYKGWDRYDKSNRTVIWKHDTGIKIVLDVAEYGDMYKLMLFDRHGVEDEECRVYDTRKSHLEKVAVKWQESYCKFLESTRET